MKKRVILLYVVLPTGMLLFLAVLGWVLVHSVDAPAPDVSDLVPVAVRVADRDNGCVYFTQAAAALRWPREQSNAELALEEWGDASVVASVARNGEAFALLKQGLACPAYEPGGGPGPNPHRWEQCAVVLAQKAAYERRKGQSSAAEDSAGDLLRLGGCLTSHPRSLAEWHAGVMTLEMGLEEAEQLLHTMPQGEDDLARWSERLRAVGSLDRGLAVAFQRDFQRLSAAIDEYALRQPHGGLLSGYRFQPHRTRAAVARLYRQAIRNISRPHAQRQLCDVSSLHADGVPRLLLELQPNKAGRFFGDLFLPERDPTAVSLALRCSLQSYLDGLRVVVACRRYEMRHGRLPETLGRLVPEFLTAVPRDPFDGASLRYVREKAMVYAVGPDLKEAGPPEAQRPDFLPPDRSDEAGAAAAWPENLSRTRLMRRTPDDLVFRLIVPEAAEASGPE